MSFIYYPRVWRRKSVFPLDTRAVSGKLMFYREVRQQREGRHGTSVPGE